METTCGLSTRADVETEPGAVCKQGLVAPEDEALRTIALEALRSSGYLVLRALGCEVNEGMVTLSGRVHSFHLKQVAQEVLLKTGIFRSVKNRIEVDSTGGHSCPGNR